MARISKVNESTMSEDMGKRRNDRQKFVTDWVEVDGRTQRQAVFRKYDKPVHLDNVDLPEKAQANFEDILDTEYLNKT